MSMSRGSRISFTPEALRKVALLFDEVWDEIVKDDLVESFPDAHSSRAWLAESVFRLARTPWTDIQMRELLVRALRNEAARRQRSH